MKKVAALVGLVALFSLNRVAAQDTMLYSKALTNPYCDVAATLELWGDAEGTVQEYVNYTTYAENPEEKNMIRVNSDEHLRIVWRLSETASMPTLREVYEKLTDLKEASVSETRLTLKAAVSVDGQEQFLEAGNEPQSRELVLVWPDSGVRCLDFTLSYNVEELSQFGAMPLDASSGVYGIPHAQKKIQIQWIRGDIASLSVGPIESVDGFLQTTVATANDSNSDRPAWRTINLWEDGVSLAPNRVSIRTLGEENGVRSELVSWVAEYGKNYQLQVVDRVGQSLSVFYPILNVKR